MLAVELVRRGAKRHGSRTAVVAGADRLTFTEVDRASNRMAHVLAGLGAGRGARVGLLVDNGLWSIPMDFACLKAGTVRVPLNSRLSVVEHAQMLAETGARTLVFSPHLAPRASELAERLDGLRLVSLGSVADHDAPGSALNLLAAKDDASPTDPMLPTGPDDLMLLMYTSGTTGTLKAAQHTQASWAATAANVLANLVSPGPDSTMLHAASLFHASGFFVLPYWVRGGTAAVLPRFDPDSYLDALARHRATEINLVPTMLGMLFASGATERADLSSLRTAVYGASPMPRPLIERALQAWGPRFIQYYGQSEAPLAITALDRHDHTESNLLGCCGQPAADAEVAVCDPDGQPVAPGEIGEIRVRAPFGMAGYYNAPDRNAETLTPDGWIRTRDLARTDDRGYVSLVDRSSDMIITGGYNVYPREVEDALMAHPAVAEAAVVGAPDATWVEAVTAFVALRPGASVSPAELRDTVRGRIAGYKVPKTVTVIDAIPKSPVGKILRRALRDPLWTSQREPSLIR
ncbi:MAG: class I adenylate-forming enzyme family protein [Pseudonocardiaceae bacterium]